MQKPTQIVYWLANEFLKFKMVIGRKSEAKNINKVEKY